jgi:hypothetical protein
MRNLAGRAGSVEQAVQRERARRAFLQMPAEDLDAEIERWKVDVVDLHLRELVDRITPDARRREATKRAAIKAAAELAGPGASPVLRQIAMAVVMFSLESDLASARLLAAAGTWAAPPLALVQWRASAELRLNSKLRTLSYVRNMEESALQGSLNKLRLAAG